MDIIYRLTRWRVVLRKDPSKIASYRIITMQNTIGKLPEKIVAQMLAAELEEKNAKAKTLG